MSDVQWVLFSKERTLQAKSCILSLAALSDTRPEDVTVLYLDSETISYEPLKKEFPCRFARQTNFYEDVRDILKNTQKPLIGFMVDDLIFKDRFSCAEIEGLMHRYRDLDSFSLRLGRNIQDGKTPEFEELQPGILSWKTAKGLGKTWNYFWELSSSIYRKELVLDYLNRLSGKSINFPNPMEFRYYNIMPNFYIGSGGFLKILTHPKYILWTLFSVQDMVKRMACYERSRAFTQGVNLVAERRLNYRSYITPEELHKLFLEGCRIDFECLRDVQNTKPNVGSKYFQIVGPDNKVHPLSVFK